MPSPSTGNLTPSLHCPRCMQPFKIPQDKVGALLRCKRCDLRFRVAHDQAGGFEVRKEGSASSIPPAPRTVTPTRLPEFGPTTSYPGEGRRSPATDPAAAPVTMRPGAPPTDEDETMLGKPIAPNGHAPEAASVNRTVMGQPIAPAPAPAAASSPPPPTSRVGLVLLAVVVLAGVAVMAYMLFPGLFTWKGNGAGPGGGGAPVSLGKYGGIEIGSTGVKRVGVEYFQTDGGIKEALLDEPQDDNPALADLTAAGDFKDDVLKATVNDVSDYFDALRGLGVPADNVYIGCSSGVKAAFKGDAAAYTRNFDRLCKAVHDKTGRDPDPIEAHDEGKFAFAEIVPPDDWDDSVLIDVGGGNIKGGGKLRGVFKEFDVPAGVSTFEKNVTKDRRPDETFAQAAARLIDTELKKPLDEKLSAWPEQMLHRKKVHFLGGLLWATATYTHPVEFYTPSAAGSYHRRLSAADFDLFGEMVRSKKPAEIKADLLAKTADQPKEIARAVVENVDKIQGEVFKKPERLIGGAQILAVLDQEFGMKAENKEIWVFRYGQVAWLLGFVKERSGHLTEPKSTNS